jgi:glycosyltransferase involved in cell wall biosynthesis
VGVVPGTIDLATMVPATDPAALRAELGIPDGALVVGASGTTDERKGPDLLLRVLQRLQRRRPDLDVHVLWVGGEPGGPRFWRIEAANGAPAADRVHFIGPVADPAAYYSLMDVFCLTSREDPFPRVCLEVAALGIPTVTFASGGAPEFVDRGAGLVVGFLDVAAMADRVADLLDDPELRAELGRRGSELVRAEFTIDQGGPATLAEIERGLSG